MAKNISAYLKDLKKKSPEDLVTVAKAVDPANFDVTAILKHMEVSGLFPLLVFEKSPEPEREDVVLSPRDQCLCHPAAVRDGDGP